MSDCKAKISHQRELIWFKMLSDNIDFGKPTVSLKLFTGSTEAVV